MPVVADHDHPAAGLIQQRGHDAAMQHAGIALKLLGRGIGGHTSSGPVS